MTITYGSQQSALFSRDVPSNEPMKPGSVYSANYVITGIKTHLPGWEDEAIIAIRNGLESQGMEIIYIGVDSDNDGIDVQWKLANYGEAQAMVVPVIAYYVAAFVIIAIVSYLLIITMVGALKEISDIMLENPYMVPVIYGGLAILGLVAIGYAYKQIKGE